MNVFFSPSIFENEEAYKKREKGDQKKQRRQRETDPGSRVAQRGTNQGEGRVPEAEGGSVTPAPPRPWRFLGPRMGAIWRLARGRELGVGDTGFWHFLKSFSFALGFLVGSLLS